MERARRKELFEIWKVAFYDYDMARSLDLSVHDTSNTLEIWKAMSREGYHDWRKQNTPDRRRAMRIRVEIDVRYGRVSVYCRVSSLPVLDHQHILVEWFQTMKMGTSTIDHVVVVRELVRTVGEQLVQKTLDVRCVAFLCEDAHTAPLIGIGLIVGDHYSSLVPASSSVVSGRPQEGCCGSCWSDMVQAPICGCGVINFASSELFFVLEFRRRRHFGGGGMFVS